MNLYYNTTAQCRVDEFNTRIAAKPILHYGACPVWELHFYSGDPSETPEAVDLSDIISCRAAVDSDWNSSTEPMCRTLAADIDMSRKAEGIISVPVNANTQRYLTVVNGKQNVGAWFELRGFDDQGNVVIVVLISITCNNSIDPTGGAEPGPVDNDTATMTWVKAEIAQPLIFQFSANGETGWHSTMNPADDHYQRVKHGTDGTWSDPWPIVNGETPYINPLSLHWMIGDTDTGVSAQGIIVRIQYSADALNWHGTFSSGDKYIRFSTDNASTWSAAMKFIGDNAPPVKIQYSENGGSGSWHNELASGDYFIRFSVDNGGSWSSGSQFRAYAVRYQYGETATDTFHNNFIAGSDKFIKFSSDNGATWTNAIKFVGDDGRSFVPDATGTYAERDTYDSEDMGFSFLVTSGADEGKIYFKTADTSGEWSDGLQFTPYGLTLQYSENGTSWHTSATTSDKYIRFSTDNGTTWSAALLFKGHSTYTYTAYASDSSGNDFSLTPTGDLDFWNWIYSDTQIAAEDLTLQAFNAQGDGWRRYQGDPGITYDWLSGSAAPSAAAGKNGDWYLDTNTGNVYQKVSGAWTLKMNIIGPVGAGATPKGAWLAVTSYDKNDMVTYQGSTYIAARDNSNVEPGTSTDDWVLYVSKGDTGPAPTIGANGNWWINGVDTGLPSRGPNGVTPNIGSNGNWWIGSTDTGVKAEISGSYVTFSAVDSSGNYTLAGTTTVPYAVLTNAGNFYPVEKGSLLVNTTNNTTTLNVAPYLAYDNAASFTGTWRLYFAAGSIEAGDDIATLSTTAITPQHGAIFRKTLAASDAFTINTADLTASKQVTFELHLIQPATAVSFTLPNTILWPDLENFASGNLPPAMTEADTLYCIVIRWDGDDLLANLAYSKAVTA